MELERILAATLKHLRLVLFLALLSAGLAAVYILLIQKRTYESDCRLFVRNPMTALGGGMSSNAGGGLAAAFLKGDTEAEYVLALLNGSSLPLAVREACSLKSNPHYWGDMPMDERTDRGFFRVWKKAVRIKSKANLITITVQTTDAALSQRIAQSVINTLMATLKEDNNRAREVLTKSLDTNLKRLYEAENKIKKLLIANGELPSEELYKSYIEGIAKVEEELVLKKAELEGLKAGVDSSGTVETIDQMASRKDVLEASVKYLQSRSQAERTRLVGTASAVMNYQNLIREVKVNERLLLGTSEQYGMASFKVQASLIPAQVVDAPRLPDEPLPRNAILKVLVAALVGTALGVVLAILLDMRSAFKLSR